MSDVYLRDDIARVLAAAAHSTMSAAMANGNNNTEYINGYMMAVRCMAVAFDIEPTAVLPVTRGINAKGLLPDLP